MKAELTRLALEEIVEMASGARQELSAEVQRVSCLPPVVIGVLLDGGSWRVDVNRIAHELNMDADVLERSWTSFFSQMNDVGERMMDRELLTPDYLSECPPALLIGLPALVLCDAIARSPEGQEVLELASGVRITSFTRPKSAFADLGWRLLMEAKKAHVAAKAAKALEVNEGINGMALLEAVMLAGGAPLQDLSPLLAVSVAATGGDGLPPLLAAVQKPIYALVYQMSQQAVFKSHFNRAVYGPLSEYVPQPV